MNNPRPIAFLRVMCLTLTLWLMGALAMAQADSRDYAITTPLVSYAPEGTAAIVSFTISNQGGDGVEASKVTIAENATGRILQSVDFQPLAAGEDYDFSTELPLADFPDGDIFLKVEVGIDRYEIAGSPIAVNNSQLIRINLAEAPQPLYDIFIPIINIGIRIIDDGIEVDGAEISWTQVIIGIVIAVLIVFLLWFLWLILRMIFRRPPSFDIWQPPYAANSYYDPDSTEGRRQSWQYHAQNSAINAPCAPDQAVAIKRLVNADGHVLGSWTIKAIRSEQYDIYGRINRSEAIMPRKLTNRLNKLASRAHDKDAEQLRKALQPIAKQMSKAVLRRVEKQNRSLPIALDIRFEGLREQARVLFELYQCRSDAWHLIDQWEPEMGLIGSRIPEHFTYSLNGQLPGESYREFKARLPQDLTQLLSSLLHQHQATAVSAPPQTNGEPFGEALSSGVSDIIPAK